MASSIHYTQYIREAKEAEAAGEPEKAASLYEKATRQKPLLEQPYARLMVLYRKLQRPEDELKTIGRALQVFTGYYDKQRSAYSGKNKIGQLSKALLKSVAGNTKAGSEYPQPVPRWLARQQQVEKKLEKKKD